MYESILRLDILSSVVNDAGEIRVKLGDVLEDNLGAGDGAAIWCSGAFLCRPNDPDADGAAQALYFADGNEKRVIGWYDGRYAAMAGQLAPGDCAIVTPGGARMFIKNEKRSLVLYTENDAGKSQIAELKGEGDGSFRLFVANCALSMKKDEMVLQCGSAQLVLTPGNIQALADYIALNAGKGNLGTIAGVVPPAPLSGIAFGAAGPVNTISANWVVAP